MGRRAVLVSVAWVMYATCAWAEVVGVRTTAFYRLIPCPKRSTPVQVDGRLDEWDLSHAPIVLAERSLDRWGGYTPPVSGDADCSALATVAWDASGVWFAGEVVDEDIVGLPEDPKAKVGHPWSYDGFILVFHPTPALLADRSRYRDNPDDIARQRAFGLNYYGPTGRPRVQREPFRYVTRKTQRGYAVEAHLPWKAMGFAGRVGDRYRFSIILADHDRTGTTFGQILWATAPAGVHYPQRYAAELRLFDRRHVACEIVPAQTDLADNEALELGVTVDALVDGAKVVRAAVTDGRGKAVWTGKVDRPVAPNRRTGLSMRIPARALPADDALVLAVTVAPAKGTALVASVPVEVRKSNPGKRAGVGAPPWPTIGPSADPSRYALPDASRTFGRKRWQPVTKEDYYQLALAICRDRLALKTRGKPAAEVAAVPQPWHFAMAVWPLAQYVHDKDPRRLAMSKAMMHATYLWEKQKKKKRGASNPMGWILRWWFYMKDHRLLAPKDEPWVRELIVLAGLKRIPMEGGDLDHWAIEAQNRSFNTAVGCDAALALRPDLPGAVKMKSFADRVWQTWWPYRDTIENTDGYSAGVVGHLLPDWGRLRGVDVYRDKGWQALAGRWLYEIAPCGARPSYSDGNTFNGSAMQNLALFERLAALTRNGRYKWAAHRLFEWASQNTRDWTTWHLPQDTAASELFWAYLYGDDRIKPVVPKAQCRVTYRKHADVVPFADRRKQRRTLALTHKNIPSKLVLTSGMGRMDLWALVQLCPSLGHSQGVAPNITCLMSHYSALLTDQSYMDRAPAFHNVVTIEDLEGLAAAGERERITVPDLGETRMAAYACVDIDLYRGWPVRHRRQIVFLKNRLVWVKDDVIFHDGFLCRVGPRWHTRQVFPAVGPNWANTFIDFHLSTGMGKGRGLHRTENPNYDLLVWFVPQKGCRVTHLDRSRTNIWQTLPQQLHYVWQGLAKRKQKLSFGTVLWPHPCDRDPGKWADKVVCLHDSPDVCAVAVTIHDTLRYVMVLNDTGRMQTAGPVATDARLCVIYEFKGKAHTVMVYKGSTVRYRDATVLKLDTPQTTQKAVK